MASEGREPEGKQMLYFVDEQLDDDEQLSVDAAIAGYEEEVRAWEALEAERFDLRYQQVFR